MNADKESMRLYVVTDRAWLGENSLAAQVEQTILAGATFVQLREKDLAFEEFVMAAKEIKEVTDKYKIPFVINDNVDVALETGADGVHIGQNDEEIAAVREKLGYSKIIGLSVHNADEAVRAEKCGADYIGIGAVFQTNTKLDADTVTYDTIINICNAVSIPVVAIGGISKTNILELSGSGVDGVAVVSAIFAQLDIGEATSELLALSKEMLNIK